MQNQQSILSTTFIRYNPTYNYNQYTSVSISTCRQQVRGMYCRDRDFDLLLTCRNTYRNTLIDWLTKGHRKKSTWGSNEGSSFRGVWNIVHGLWQGTSQVHHMHIRFHNAAMITLWQNKYWPFSENEMLVIGPWCPEKFATFVRSFKSHIFTIESSVPVPKIRPSGWNWAHVRPGNIQTRLTCIQCLYSPWRTTWNHYITLENKDNHFMWLSQ